MIFGAEDGECEIKCLYLQKNKKSIIMSVNVMIRTNLTEVDLSKTVHALADKSYKIEAFDMSNEYCEYCLHEDLSRIVSVSKKEKGYEFRERLLQIHKKNIRDYSIRVEADELVICNETVISIPEDDVIYTAAKDFVDFMLTSMNVSVMVKYNCENADISLRLKEENENLEGGNGYMGYHISVDDSISICGYDSRGAAQALYYLEDVMIRKQAPFIKKGTISRKTSFAPRMIHSGYGLDNYPNEHLSAIAHAGMDAILVYVKGIDCSRGGYLDFNRRKKKCQ
mgnify:CR=1 FL=1